jgi:divalent metal cation (Fe/Co/Zn/Cd) transporter
MNVIPESARRAVALERLTVALSALEAVAALVSGILAGSVALVAFGADSVIEVMSAVVVLGQLRAMVRSSDASADREHRSHRIIAVLFFALATYVVVSASIDLVMSRHPSENALGFVVCFASIALMPSLAWAKRTTSRSLAREGSAAVARLLNADASETALCALLSVSTLLGVSLAAWVGWWWADPVASLAVVYFALREGAEAWRCDPD